MSLFTAQLHPGRALGFLVLGASLHDILTRLKAEPHRFPKLDLTYSPTDPVRDPVVLALPANGLRLRFDGPEQRLRLIEVLDFTKNHIFFREQNKDRDLVKPSSADAPAPTGGPTFRHIYSRFLGPTYDGEFVPGEGNGSSSNSTGTYVLSYPGVAFTFPMARSAYSPDKDVVSLLSTPSNLAAVSMAVFSGDSWAQARDHLWTEVLPAIKSFTPLAKGKDVAPDEVSLVNIHGGGKLQLFRRWAQPAQPTSTDDAAASADASSFFWITLGETTPQELVAELGPPDAIYRKSDQRMYIHKIRTASTSRSRRPTNNAAGSLGTSDPHSYNAAHGRRPDETLTDTDQSSIPTASSDDDDGDDAAEDEFMTGNVSSECFFNYFYLGFDVLVSTPTTPSRLPPSLEAAAAGGGGGGSGAPPPERPLKSAAPDRLVATKLVLHGNVPGSYPFNRHRRCRWSIAYAPPGATVDSESPFAQIEEQLHRAWRPIYASDEEARQRQRGMVLNRGWGDSPGSSIELLGGWEESQRVASSGAGRGGRGGGGGNAGTSGSSTLRGVKGTEDSTTTLYGFPGLVFEVLRNGYVSALTVF
ncbi:hypothetical protein HMPREF1624_07354 [Sporothrix schenckii ATCC 58251]|uniref:Uncharacterized protein n=1 Tax=Sporothrix schenckii (strain ATCC 58251 / de Perez 2211183) TaxID=1391915 RepID=U7PLE3_SPOS1|nr:hypothetical protein HMPREF1624_07354 [Sporothrix schenckii ATCC 58251]